MSPGVTPPFLRAHSARFEARLAARRGEHERVEPSFVAAADAFRELELPFWLAVTLLEHAEWLSERGRAGEIGELLDEAKAIFERLKVRPWLERLERVVVPEAAVATPPA
jgi:hypothetical protein